MRVLLPLLLPQTIVGNDSDEITLDYAQVASYISQHPEMNSVLLSGGDPFVLSTRKLHRIMDHLLPLPNLTSIRFGTKTRKVKKLIRLQKSMAGDDLRIWGAPLARPFLRAGEHIEFQFHKRQRDGK